MEQLKVNVVNDPMLNALHADGPGATSPAGCLPGSRKIHFTGYGKGLKITGTPGNYRLNSF